MGYLTLAVVTDYDCWMEDESKHADITEIFRIYGETINKVRNIIETLSKNGLSETPPWIRTAMAHAVMTPADKLSQEQQDWLSVLRD